MTRQLAWLTALLVGGTALAMLLVSLAFVPVDRWEAYVPIAASIAAIGLILAAFVVEAAGDRLIRPMRRLVRSIEQDAIGGQSLHDLVRQAPSEMAPLLYGLHVTHARLRRTVEELEQERAEMSALFEHMADSVLVLDADERVVLGNPAAERVLSPALVGRRLNEITHDAELLHLARSVSDSRTEMRLIEFSASDGGVGFRLSPRHFPSIVGCSSCRISPSCAAPR